MKRKLLTLILTVALLGGGYLGYSLWRFAETPLAGSGKEVTIVVEPRQGLSAVAARLAAQGHITQPRYLTWLARLRRQATSIQPGEYALEPGLTPLQLLDNMVAGKIVQYPLTLVEGWNFRQVLALLHAHPKLTPLLKGLSEAQQMERLGLKGQHPEGMFFPDTYYIAQGQTDLEVLQRAHQAMAQVLKQEWAQRAANLPYRHPYQALIMASIVEKETAVPHERTQVAGVFVRRLQRGIPLATDPTVIYGLGAAFDGNLRKEDLLRDGPYNTYRRAGLPPTPIAMPGRAALHAALHPDSSEALYFVARGDGTHQFSATLDAHNAAVRRYQLR